MSSVEINTKPQAWEIKEIQEIASPNHSYAVGDGDHGQIKSTWYKEEGIPYIRVGDILDDGSISFKKIVYISQKVHNDNKKSHLLPGDILIAKTGATIGKVAIIPESIPTSNTTASVGKITLNRLIADTKFIFYYLNSSDFKKDMWAVSHKSAQPGFNIKDLKCFKVPIPPLEEQKRIVEKIDTLFAKIDKAIRLTEDSLKQAKNLLPSVLKEVFEKGKANGWEEKKLEEVCDVIGGGTPKTKISEYWNGEIVWLSPIDLPPIGEISMVRDSRKKITEIGLKKSSAKLLPKGSVVYSTRASIGKIAIAEIPLSTNQGFTNFICGEGLNNRYLCFCLRHFNENIENLSNSTTFKEVSKSSVKEFEIPVPSIDSQMKVVKIADDVLLKSKQTQSKLEEQLAYLKQLKSSILSKAFSGNL